MGRALQLAESGLYTTHPNPRVGCVILRGGEIVGEGWHERAGGPHAEVVALRAAGERAAGATAYVTLEPCCHQGRTPPCTEALIGAGVTRLVFAVADPHPRVAGGGARRLAGARIEVLGGVLEADARALNIGFFSRFERDRPWVRSKLAISVDGRIALANGVSRWISSEAARRDAHRLRARSSAILTGVGTVNADDPAFNVRRSDLESARPPDRIVLDSRLRMAATAQLLRQPGETRIMCVQPDPARQQQLEAAGAVVEPVPAINGRPDPHAVLKRLSELENNEILVEAGPGLNGCLLRAGLIDELVVYLAPRVLGGNARGMFDIPELTEMSVRPELELTECRRLGSDLRLTYRTRVA